jgi:hypothetical protein
LFTESPRDPFLVVFHGSAAFAHYIGGDYAEATRAARVSIRMRADFAGGYRPLVAAAAMAGQPEVAATALQELRRLQPNLSLAWLAREIPIKEAADLEHYIEGFRRAGLQ